VSECDPAREPGTGCAAAALKADAVNRQRHIECQLRQRALADCLRTLEASGVLRQRDP
jgi:hypothetical protein